MSPPVGQRRLLHLHPGHLYFGSEEVWVSTILGSCVSVALYHPASRHGSLTHAILPAPRQPAADEDTDPRYVEASILHSLDFFARIGVTASQLRAKIFGGAETLGDTRRMPVGRQNIYAAVRVLADHGLAPVSRHVGGPRGRRLLFDPQSGTVYVKTLGAQDTVMP